jgi:hypothetical protein
MEFKGTGVLPVPFFFAKYLKGFSPQSRKGRRGNDLFETP